MKISPFQSSQIFTQKFRFTPSCVADRNEEDICTFVGSNLLILVEKNSMKFSVLKSKRLKIVPSDSFDCYLIISPFVSHSSN